LVKLVRCCAISILIFAATILVTRLISHAQPLPTPGMFTNPDGSPCTLPCLFGIRPGVTTTKEAVALLRAHPLTQSLYFDEQRMVLAGIDAEVLVIWHNNLVTSILLDRFGPSFNRYARPQSLLVEACNQASLGNVINLFGLPDHFGGEFPGDSVHIDYSTISISFRHRTTGNYGSWELTPNGQFASVNVYASPDMSAYSDPGSRVPWRGFIFIASTRLH
jgi:hypothetical protein